MNAFGREQARRLVLHCCNSKSLDTLFLHAMSVSLPRQSNKTTRPLYVRWLALLLFIAQLGALLIVPLHALAHARGKYASAAAVDAAGDVNGGNAFSSLFGHAQGLGCDDWSAAFALDSHSGHSIPNLPATAPAATNISCSLPAAPPATPFRQFLARAPPRH